MKLIKSFVIPAKAGIQAWTPASAGVTKMAIKLFTSLKLTIVCLSLLMALVIGCTLAQVHLGTWGAVEMYMRSFFLWWGPIPVYPGGALVGLVLMVNLIAAQFARLERSWRKAGIWMAHAGLILLFTGEFVTGMFAVETQMVIEEGASKNYVERPRSLELAIIDTSPAEYDEVVSVPQAMLARKKWIRHTQLPFQLGIEDYDEKITDDESQASFQLKLRNGNENLGSWKMSSETEDEVFEYQGKSYRLSLRPERHYLPYSLTLKDFKHDIYPGTDIPKNFSSSVRLDYPEKKESRDVLIYMNNPLRYEGKAFYQASFGKNDTLSVLQVVENPGWLLPYISCALVALGLIFHFVLKMRESWRA